MAHMRRKIQFVHLLPFLLLTAFSVTATGVSMAQSAAPAPDAPNSPVAVPPAPQSSKDPRTLIQTQTPAPPPAQNADRSRLHPGAAHPVNRRLILTDGSYQLVRSYQIVGDRVRYFSVDREDWEELPTSLVDWKATHAWEQNQSGDHAPSPADRAADSDAMREAAELDREEAAQRAAVRNIMPEVVPGLRLLDRDGVFALDHFGGQPQLVELTSIPGTLNSSKINRLRAMLPLSGQRDQIEIDGAIARVRLHDSQPQIYLSLEDKSSVEQAPANAVTVPTHNAPAVQNNPRGAASSNSGFAIVRVDQRREMRIIGNVRVSSSGQVTQSENVQPVTTTVLPGGHWMRITPSAPLPVGEYALVQILSPTDLSDEVWDFSIHPDAPENPSVIVPIAKR